MNGEYGPEIGQILRAINFGNLPSEEIERRLRALIEAEIGKNDDSVNVKKIEACQDLLLQLNSSCLNSNGNSFSVIQKSLPMRKKSNIPCRAIVALLTVAIVLWGGVLKNTHLTGSSTVNGQQYIIQGNEITSSVIQNAIAEHNGFAQYQVETSAEVYEILGFDPHFPCELMRIWNTQLFNVLVTPDFIQISSVYTSDQAHNITYTHTLFANVEEAYMSIEQNGEGKIYHLKSTDIYESKNDERTLFLWQHGLSVNLVSGTDSTDLLSQVVQEIIGGED